MCIRDRYRPLFCSTIKTIQIARDFIGIFATVNWILRLLLLSVDSRCRLDRGRQIGSVNRTQTPTMADVVGRKGDASPAVAAGGYWLCPWYCRPPVSPLTSNQKLCLTRHGPHPSLHDVGSLRIVSTQGTIQVHISFRYIDRLERHWSAFQLHGVMDACDVQQPIHINLAASITNKAHDDGHFFYTGLIASR